MEPYLDRRQLKLHPLSERENRVRIREAAIFPGDSPSSDDPELDRTVSELARDIEQAREADAPVVLAFGAHTIKNGMGPLLSGLARGGWVTHLATNGAGIIHDWEFAYAGESSEHVEENVQSGRFGLWEETGFYINLAIVVGAFRGRGYGESVGAFVEEGGLDVPTEQDLEAAARLSGPAGGYPAGRSAAEAESAAAAADLLALTRRIELEPGRYEVSHPYRRFGLQAAAYRLGVPFTSHPMFGHDIIYCHPANYGAAIGRAAERDFLSFAETIRRIDGGVYLSVGSAVMSPMIFEKSFAMAQNLALQESNRIENHRIYVVDLTRSSWDWKRQGEPPESDPAYYLRFLKTFSRMGGEMRYVAADNRELLLRLARELGVSEPKREEGA